MTTSRQDRVIADLDHKSGREADLQATLNLAEHLTSNLATVLLGASAAVTYSVVAVLAGGHILIEDVPGVGKTVLARALAASLGSELSRVQGNPDLLPSDITGVSVFSPETSSWEFRPGPVFSHVVLVDELNRTPPRTQSALLETMEEQQVTVDGESWPLPRPHLVIATQNPFSQRGTYPLVESQLDRFAIAITIGYPQPWEETQLLLHHGGKYALSDLQPVSSVQQWQNAQIATELVTVAASVASYAVEISRATRQAPRVRLGASPRAAIWLIRCAQAHAVVNGRTYVLPDDVKAMAVPCLAHRVIADDGEHPAGAGAGIVEGILNTVPSPRP